MRFNLLYVLFVAALASCFWIVRQLQHQSINTFFGTAETEGRAVSLEYAVLIQRIYIQVGAQVQKGDTLAIAYRAELDRKTSENQLESSRLATERDAEAALLVKDRDLLVAAQAAHKSELEAQIKVIEAELAVQNNLRNAISDRPVSAAEGKLNVKQQEIAALREEIAQGAIKTREELRRIEAKAKVNTAVYGSQLRQTQGSQSFLDIEKSKLVLLAPADGYVQQVGAAANELVPSFRELFRISPQKPDKVIGFLHESAEIQFQLGDTVLLTSMSRVAMTSRAVLNGVSPKLVELPFRLRKFTELRTWGREVYIQLPADNPFFIGEKILITVNQQL